MLTPAGGLVLLANGAAAASLLLRARLAEDPVRFRLTLFGWSAACAGLFELTTRLMAARDPGRVECSLFALLAAAALAGTTATAVAGLVLAGGGEGGGLRWLRRLLDGWLVAGSMITLAWVFVARDDPADQNPSERLEALMTVGWLCADIVLIGLLLALRCSLPRGSRVAISVAAAGLGVLVAGEVARLLHTAPHGSFAAEAAKLTGVLTAAAAPWLPGSITPPGGTWRARPGPGVLAALVAPIACVAVVLAHVVTWRIPDLATTLLGATVVLALFARQWVTQLGNLRLTRNLAVCEERVGFTMPAPCDVTAIVSRDGVLRYISPTVGDALGYRPESLMGLRLPALLHPDDSRSLAGTVNELLDGGPSGDTVSRVRCRVRGADGRWHDTRSTISRHADGLIIDSVVD